MTDIKTLPPEEQIKCYSALIKKIGIEISRLRKKKYNYPVSKRGNLDHRIQVMEHRRSVLQIEREMLKMQEKKTSILAIYPWMEETLYTHLYTSQDPNEKA